MARTFNGTTDNIRTAISTSAAINALATFLCVVKRNSTGWNGLIVSHDLGGTGNISLEITDNAGGNHLNYGNSSFTANSNLANVVNADNWCLVGASKATGNVAPRFHRYKYDTDAWIHETGSGNVTDGSASPTSGTYRLGQWQTTDFLNGDMAIAAVWNRALADAEIELLPFSLTAWYASAPVALWVLDQAATTMTMNDLTGGGSNQSAITGTTVSTNSVPVFNFGDGAWLVQRAQATTPPADIPPGLGPVVGDQLSTAHLVAMMR